MAERSRTTAPSATGVKADAENPQAEAQAPHDNLPLLDDLPLMLTIELGRSKATLGLISSLGEQSLIELDQAVGEPVNILLNNRLFARGEVVTVSENFGVRITEIVGAA